MGNEAGRYNGLPVLAHNGEQGVHDALGTRFSILLVGLHFQEGRLWRFKRRTDPGKVLDLTPARLGVEALYVPLLAGCEGSIYVHFQEIFGANDGTGHLANRLGGADEGADRNQAAFEQQFGRFGRPADVFAAVFLAEAQVVAEPGPKVVAVEQVGQKPPFVQGAFQRPGQCAFARTR